MNFGLNKVIGENETGFRGRDDVLYRTEAWMFLLAGGGLYNNLDYSFTPSHPDGTRRDYQSPGGGSPELRQQLRILKEFLEGLDFIRLRPDKTTVQRVDLPLTWGALSDPGKAYAIYLHVPLPQKPKNLPELVGKPRTAQLTVDLPQGVYLAEWIATRTGNREHSEELDARGGTCVLRSPEFVDDIALRIRRK
jgi:hypothetical protein